MQLQAQMYEIKTSDSRRHQTDFHAYRTLPFRVIRINDILMGRTQVCIVGSEDILVFCLDGKTQLGLSDIENNLYDCPKDLMI